MRQNEYKALADEIKKAANGKLFTNYSYGHSYVLQEDKGDIAQAFSITFVSDNLIKVNFYTLHNLQKNSRGWLSYQDSKDIKNDYHKLTDKQVYAMHRLMADLYTLSDKS